MRIIHTSDVHLDASFAGAGMPPDFGNRRRQSLRDVFRDIVARAAAWPADVLLIAGDLFEAERVTRDTVAFLKSEFESLAPIPVFVAPGNHDPYVQSCPYSTDSWPGNVVIFREPTWAEHVIEETLWTVHGFGFDGADVSRNPFGNLQIPRDGRIHVAVAHGSEMGCLPPDKGAYAPFSAAAASADRLRYLALGHYHAMKEIATPFGTRMFYCGAPEGHGFGETGVHCFLEVEVEEESVQVRPVESSRSVYSVHTVDCTGFSTSQQVVDTIRELGGEDERPRIARVVLEGMCAWQEEVPAIRDAVAPEFEYLDVVDRLEPEEDYETLAREDTSLGAFVREMSDEVRNAVGTENERLVRRAREVGVAAYRGRDVPVRGMRQE